LACEEFDVRYVARCHLGLARALDRRGGAGDAQRPAGLAADGMALARELEMPLMVREPAGQRAGA
jgi:hypothetical protein